MKQFNNNDFTIFQSQLYKTTSTVVHTNDCVVVVDPTWLPNEVKEIQSYVNRIRKERPLYLLFTHSDWDHILGYGAFPDAIVIASEEFVRHKDQEGILEQIRAFDDEYYLDRDYSIVYPKVDVVVQEEGQVLEIGETILTFYKAKGHTADGIFTIVEPLGLWVAGDYFSDVEFPYLYDCSSRYEATLHKTDEILRKHHIRCLIPGHGRFTNSIEEIQKRKRESLEYILNLRKATKRNEDTHHLIEGYSYPNGMANFHRENMKLIKNELNESGGKS